MDLKTILDLCQDDHIGKWRRIPGGGPLDKLMTGFVDVASTDESPALAALQHKYRAVYEPDISVTLAWGMPPEDWRDERRDGGNNKPEWLPTGPATLKSAYLKYAHVLYNGAVIWEVGYAYADWGSGIGGCLPWPEPKFDGNVAEPKLLGWEASQWEDKLTRLLTDLQRDGAEFYRVMDAERAGITLVKGHPLWD
ncbi:MAG TPA: hypothetical protein VN618_04275 [Solirubrobacteraceae bacterium]|nr:hypothetical protein [Solirubrobacteraceae bacterium]